MDGGRSQDDQWYSYWMASHRLPQQRWTTPPSYLGVPREVIGRNQEFHATESCRLIRIADEISVVIGRSWLHVCTRSEKGLGSTIRGKIGRVGVNDTCGEGSVIRGRLIEGWTLHGHTASAGR